VLLGDAAHPMSPFKGEKDDECISMIDGDACACVQVKVPIKLC
jgi:hypothetical protein